MQFGLTMEHEGQTDYVVTVLYQVYLWCSMPHMLVRGMRQSSQDFSLSYSRTCVFGTGSGILFILDTLASFKYFVER